MSSQFTPWSKTLLLVGTLALLFGFAKLDADLPVTGAAITLDGGSILHTFKTTTGPDGRFKFEKLPEGDYLFVLSYDQLRKLSVPSPHRPVFFLTVDHMKQVMIGNKRAHFPIPIQDQWEGFTISVPAGGAKVSGVITSDQPCQPPGKE